MNILFEQAHLLAQLSGVNIPQVRLDNSSIEFGLNFILQLAAALSLIFILLSAVKFTASGGDPQRVAESRRTIVYALVGLVVSVSSFIIASLVGEEASQVAQDPDPFFGPTGIVTKVVDWLSFVVGAASVFGIIYGAVRFITSAGQAQSAQAGRNAIVYSVIGIIVAVAAQFIVTFVLGRI